MPAVAPRVTPASYVPSKPIIKNRTLSTISSATKPTIFVQYKHLHVYSATKIIHKHSYTTVNRANNKHLFDIQRMIHEINHKRYIRNGLQTSHVYEESPDGSQPRYWR